MPHAVHRARLSSLLARRAFELRAGIVERSFAHNGLDRGGMRQILLRRRETVHKRHLLHVDGHNPSLTMRQPIGAGTPKEAVPRGYMAIVHVPTPDGAILVTPRVLHSARLGYAIFPPRERASTKRPFCDGLVAPSQTHDNQGAPDLLNPPLDYAMVLGNRADDAGWIGQLIRGQTAWANIPPTSC